MVWPEAASPSVGLGNSSSNDNWGESVAAGERAFLGFVGVVMALVGGIGNGIVVVLVCRSAAMRSAINLLLAAMALSDTVILLLLLPLDLITLAGGGWLFPSPICSTHAFLLNAMQIQGVAALSVICVDRYIIIVHQQEVLTPCITCCIIAVSWVVSLAVSLPPFFGVGIYTSLPLPPGLTHCEWRPREARPSGDLVFASFTFLVIYLLPVLVMSFSFAGILLKIRQNSAKIHSSDSRRDSSYAGVIPAAQGDAVSPTSARRPLVTVDLRYKTQTLTTVIVLSVVFFLWRSPLHLSQLAHAFSSHLDVSYKVYPWFLWCAYVPPAVNPVIYTARIKKFRNAVVDIFPCLLSLLPCTSSALRRLSNPGTIYMIHHPRREST
ncbi:high-affinity lysophosphatidic acid receptor-like [Penaeus monodon]|uniref:high-affinity lysophosphatidic acid receptor-like n=1 Tax=Penaeus monodon TaxID=6687 RepID=UPI0018A7AE86|nr:high-affinity lysophosphatidic acid receptor-like [Penaeus monodon]XP_037798100.1 high-affinity lysophosphatidic acid receptor-like [Penaeus monodon]